MMGEQVELAIVGAGPAGLAAAIEAAKLGVETVVLDMYPQAGGQYFKLPSAGFAPSSITGVERAGQALMESARQAGAELRLEHVTWALYPDQPILLCATAGTQAYRLRPQQIVIASGAYDRPVPFPGWTLPGVLTAGGVQVMLKNQRVLPGRRFLLAGTGPLQWAVGASLVVAGAEVTALLESRRPLELAKQWVYFEALLGQGERLREGWRYWRVLHAAGVPIRFGWAVARAEGGQAVERAVIVRLDESGRPVAGTEQTLPVDAICLGYGLLPSAELWRQLNCQWQLDRHFGTPVPIRNEWMATSVAGVFVVGDAAGIVGKEAAMLEGRLAGLAIAQQLGRLSPAEAEELARPLRKRLVKEYRFAQFLAEAFALPAGLWNLADDDTVVCRCEGVTLRQIKQALVDGATLFPDVKAYTRAGMGRCQGRMCVSWIMQFMARRLGQDLQRTHQYQVRPPAFPVSLEEVRGLGVCESAARLERPAATVDGGR